MQNQPIGLNELGSPLTLRSGVRLKNRIVKVSTEEALADADYLPDERLARLYRRFADGGAGMILTGAVIVDRRARARPRDVVVEGRPPLAPFRRWAEAATDRGASIWMQINHSGRQTPRFVTRQPLGPSAIPAVKVLKSFGAPRAMTGDEIRDLIRRFADTAEVAAEAGFSGVQIHAAHGYLLSQFLSPSANLRTDAWGGTPEKRAKLLLEVIDAVGERLAGRAGIAVKVNASDLQRGGTDPEQFRDLVLRLADRPLDFLEISGGTYEASVFEGASMGPKEAYFVEAARAVRTATDVPLLLTGGIRSREVMDRILADGVADLVGLGRPLLLDPDLPTKLLSGAVHRAEAPETKLRSGVWSGVVDLAWYARQLHRLADDRPLVAWWTRWWAAVRHVGVDAFLARRRSARRLPAGPRRTFADPAAWMAAFTAFWTSPHDRSSDLHDLLDPDVRLVTPGFRPTRGIDAGLATFERLFAAFPDLSARVDRWVADGDWLFVEMTFTATVGRRRLEWPSVDRFRLRDGRAVERIAFTDPTGIRRALATSPSGWMQFRRLWAVAG